MQSTSQRIRLAIDLSQMGSINDVITGETPAFWNGTDIEFELAFFWGTTLLNIGNWDSVTVDVKQSDPRTGLPVMSATLSSGSLNNSLNLTAWQGGAPTDCHALVPFTNSETNLDLDADTETFWFVVSVLTNASPAGKIIAGATPLNVTEGGDGVEPPSYVATPIYFTAAQSDARYSRTVDLTSINASIATLNSEMTAVTATANAAMPLAGGTFSGAVTITGLSGVLQATSGLISGSATTSVLPEGSNLYWTQARFNTALAAMSGAASGVCPLDSGSLIPAAYLPSITVHNTFVVSSQAAMLALSAHQGDVAVRTDINESFILTNNVPTVLGNWTELLTPASAVVSVNGLSGTVTLTTTQITEGTNLYFTNARAQAQALAATLTGFSNATGGNVTSSDDILVALGRLENRCAINDGKISASGYVKADGSVAMTSALQFTGGTNAGIVLSNLNDTQRAALTPLPGTVIYDTTLSQFMGYNGAWVPFAIGGGTSWYSGTGAPASTLGESGDYYLNISNGNVYLNTSGTWAVIYTPASVSALPLTGGTLSGQLAFSGVAQPINFGNGFYFAQTSVSGTTTLSLYTRSGSGQAFTIVDNGTTTNFDVGNGYIRADQGFYVSGIQVVGAQQAHITHDSSGAANQTTVNAILTALEAHGLVHS